MLSFHDFNRHENGDVIAWKALEVGRLERNPDQELIAAKSGTGRSQPSSTYQSTYSPVSLCICFTEKRLGTALSWLQIEVSGLD
jgi:hypothetical protein